MPTAEIFATETSLAGPLQEVRLEDVELRPYCTTKYSHAAPGRWKAKLILKTVIILYADMLVDLAE